MGIYETNNTLTTGTYCVCIASNSCTSISGNYYVCVPPPMRRIAVRLPGKWSKRVKLAWVKLFNEDTDTGWKVEMLIEGTIIITDPNIEQRDIQSFIELAKWRASDKDKKKLDAFMRRHGK